jgi:hypothetical protein
MIAKISRHPRLTIGLAGIGSVAIFAELFHLFRTDLRSLFTGGS